MLFQQCTNLWSTLVQFRLHVQCIYWLIVIGIIIAGNSLVLRLSRLFLRPSDLLSLSACLTIADDSELGMWNNFWAKMTVDNVPWKESEVNP